MKHNLVFPNLNSAPQSGGPFENYQREAGANDERFDFMDFSDFQDLQNLEEETRRTPDDYDDTDSFYQTEENHLRHMGDEDLKEGGPNKRLMTRDAWEEGQEVADLEEAEEENVREGDMETEKMKAKVKKPKRKRPTVWDDFVDEVDEDTQPWTPVTPDPRSPDENL